MHLLTLSEPVFLGKTLGVLAEGEWLMHDQNAFEIANLAARGTARMTSIAFNPEFQQLGRDAGEPESTLIMRSGAIGDLLMLSPALKAWKAKTGQKVSLCCFPHHFPIFEGDPTVDELVPYPLRWTDSKLYTNIISLENTMELNHDEHATDVFAKALDVAIPLSDYRPTFRSTESEIELAKKHLFTNRPNIALQMRASVPTRDYQPNQWLEVIVGLQNRGWGVLLLGRKGQIPPVPPQFNSPFIRDLSALDLTLRESAAVLANCDAFIGVDSSFMHFAGALEIPAVSLHGPFAWQIRTAHYPKNRALSGRGDCAGCNWHLHAGRHFPPNKPCSTRGACVVLASIEPRKIIAAAELLKPMPRLDLEIINGLKAQ